MQRTKGNTKQATAILTADWHLREDQPICRTDDFEQTQWGKLLFISELQRKHDCPIFLAGDLFHHWKPSPSLLSKTIRYLPKRVHTVYGNHDLPQHNLELCSKSGVYTLEEAGIINVLPFRHWEQEDELMRGLEMSSFMGKKIYVWHKMTYQEKEPFPGCTAPKASKLLRKYPQFDLMVTGDNHKPFVEEYEGRLLVNPGSITRQRASETHKPRVYLWYHETNTVEPVYLPIEKDVITKEHIEEKEDRMFRIDAFIEKLNGDYDSTVNFDENLQKFQQANNIEPEIMNIVFKAIENE